MQVCMLSPAGWLPRVQDQLRSLTLDYEYGKPLPFSVKLVDLGCVAPHVCVMCQNIWDWLTVDCLIVYNVIPIASHICFHQKSITLAYVPEVTVTLSPLAQITFANLLLYHEVYFVFFDFFHLQCLVYSVLHYYNNICICHVLIKRYHHHHHHGTVAATISTLYSNRITSAREQCCIPLLDWFLGLPDF